VYATEYKTKMIVVGILKKLLPYILVTFIMKLIIYFCETAEWWPTIENPGIILGVIGFGIAILLGAKLSVVNARLYSIEDAVCRIVGSLRVLYYKNNLADSTTDYAKKLLDTLHDPSERNITAVRTEIVALIKSTLSEGHDGPHLAGLTRDVSYVLHRATAEIPVAYEIFLAMTITLYTIIIGLLVPGFSGFCAVFILVFVLFGASILIEDMDHSLDQSSLIKVNIEPLRFFIDQETNKDMT